MKTRTVGVVLAGGLAVGALVAVALWMGWAENTVRADPEPIGKVSGEPDARRSKKRKGPGQPPAVADRVEPEGAFDEYEPDSVAAGHHDVAEALGHTMIRCFTGRVFDTGSLGGRYLHEIHGGWYSAVAHEPSGVRLVTRTLDPPTSLLGPTEDVGVVRWAASDDSPTLIECSWEPVQYGRIHVQVFDENDQPVDGAEVRIGSAKAQTHKGLARLQRIPTHRPATLHTSYKTDAGLCMGKGVVDPVLPDAVITVDQTPDCVSWRDSQALMDDVLDEGPSDGPQAAATLRAKELKALTEFAEAHPRQGAAAMKIEAIRRVLRLRRSSDRSAEEIIDLAVEGGAMHDEHADHAEAVLLQE